MHALRDVTVVTTYSTKFLDSAVGLGKAIIVACVLLSTNSAYIRCSRSLKFKMKLKLKPFYHFALYRWSNALVFPHMLPHSVRSGKAFP